MRVRFEKTGFECAILIIILALRTQFCAARNIDSLFLSIPDSSEVIEKVYLHTDRDYYSPGDDIWFKAYLINSSFLSLQELSMNLHVELISSEHKIIDSRIIRIEKGLGKGDFSLSDSIRTGSYLIRAYTNYMRNFNDSYFFTKAIKVIGPPDSSRQLSDTIRYLADKLNVKFFPEGGSLVNDITSMVAFEAVNDLGFGCDVAGDVYSSSGEFVTSFNSTHKGMGKFFLRPGKGFDYFAVVRNPVGDTIRCRIPESFARGIVLNVSDFQNDEPLITVRTNPETLPLLLNQELFLNIIRHKELINTISFKINSLFTSFRLPTQDITDGIIQLTMAGPDGFPLCERLIFHCNENLSLELKTDKSFYRKRDSVSVEIQLSGVSETTDQTFLSLAAVENVYLEKESHSKSTISSWFLLESDIRGFVEEPSYYFEQTNTSRFNDLDLLLCTHGWRDFEWKYSDTVFLPEYGFPVSGKVKKLFSREPLINYTVSAVLKTSENEIITTTQTDSSGLFRFEEFDFTGNARLIASVSGEKEQLQGQLILDSIMYIPYKAETNDVRSKTGLDYYLIPVENLTNLQQEYEIRNNIRRKYTLSDTILLGEVEIMSQQKKQQKVNYAVQRVAVGIPHKIIEMTPTLANKMSLRDVIRGRVAGVTVGPVNDTEMSGIRMRGSSYEPLFMLDGTVVTYGMLSTFPLAWIERIEILKPGGLATTMAKPQEDEPRFGGVVSVISKPVEYRKAEEKKVFHSINKIISGFDAPRIFYSPDHSSGSASEDLPDLRSTLFWEPDIVFKGKESYKLRYFNADNRATIIITAEGITSTGIPVSGRTEYIIE